MILRIASVVLLFISLTFAQSFDATVSSTKPGLNEPITVTFSLSGQSVSGVRNFKAPDFGQFVVLSGPNTSSSYSSINGAVSMSISYSFILQARNMGKAMINSASIEVAGKLLKTKPISLDVVKGSANNNRNNNNNDQNIDLSDKVFIRAIVNKQTAYLGEEVKLTYKLYTRLGIANIEVAKLPFYKGFWSEEFAQPKIIDFKIEKYNGRDYRTYELKTAALFPTETGDLVITPLELNIPVYVEKPSNFFNDPFFNQRVLVDYKAVSNTARIKVLPLPLENRPASFNGAVGNYTIESSVDTADLKTSQPFTYKLIIKGSGNIKLLEPPTLNLPSGFEQLNPVVKDSVLRNGRITGTKEISYIIIPHTVGSIKLEEFEFSFFSPEKKSYVTLLVQSHTINVKQGIDNDVETGNLVLDKDIRDLKKIDELEKGNETEISFLSINGSFILPAIVLLVWIVRKRRLNNLMKDEVSYKNSIARKLAVKRFAKAKKLMNKELEEAFYTEINRAFLGYLMDKFNLQNSEMTIENSIELIKQKNVDFDLLDKIKAEMEKSDYLRFTPGSKTEHMEATYNSFLDLIIELEKRLTK